MRSQHIALYDGQCEICQACVSWLRLLDRGDKVTCVPIEQATLSTLHPSLTLEECLREIHILTPDERILVGWEGIAHLARLFPPTWLIGTLGSLPPFQWVGRMVYRFVAGNRYTLSKCRGGACRVARLEAVRRRAPLAPFWGCYTLGMLIRFPLSIAVAARDLVSHILVFVRTYRRRFDLLNGRLSLVFLGGIPCDLVPLIFGELFMMVVYDGVAIDPGSSRMRRSLERHLRRREPGPIHGIVATHHHEEHVGNLNWLSDRTGATIHVAEATARLLQPPYRLPPIRALVIGQPPSLERPFQILADQLPTASGLLEVIPAPGHCDDHVALYDPKQKVLLAGDAFMGTYFATPNPDVDSRKWINTLERFLELDIEIMVEGHGHIHTLRPDIPDIPGVVIRHHPKDAIREKLGVLLWLRDQIEHGLSEGLPIRAVEASCFPWGQARTWENFLTDEMARLLSLGDFSRTELVRSFVRQPSTGSVLPTVYQAQFYGKVQESSHEEP